MLYPIMLDMRGRRCVVVGGGRIAYQKLETLVRTGAEITVVAPEITPKVEELEKQGLLRILRKEYESKDIDGAFVVIGATDHRKVNERISADAQKHRILVNIVDTPDLCVFQVPASVKRDDLIIAISTAGKSPAIAKKIRKELEENYGPEYSELLDLIDQWRSRIKKCELLTLPQREHLFNTIVQQSDVLDLLKQGKKEEAQTKFALLIAELTKKALEKSTPPHSPSLTKEGVGGGHV